MIVNTTFRGQGGLAAHLQRVDTNEFVIVREDLSSFCSLEIDDAVADFAAIGVAQGATKPLIHISISPERPLSPEQECAMIDRVRAVYGIHSEQPMLVVAHQKPGDFGRPDHYHIVLPSLESDGRRISDAYYKIKNERISLELEVQFGHPLVPGPNIGPVRRQLAIERPDMAEAIAKLEAPVYENDATTVSDRNFAVTSGVDLCVFDARVFTTWEAGAFKDAAQLARQGLAVALGDHAIMVVDSRTGFSQSLLRLLNRESKRRGKALKLKKAALQEILSDLAATAGDLKTTSRALISESVNEAGRKASASAFIERQVCGVSSPIDAPAIEIERAPGPQPTTSIKADPMPIADRHRGAGRPTTIKSDLETIHRLHRELIESRKRAAARAWKSARIWRSSSLETFVAAAAAGAAIACGGGLLLGIAAAGFAQGIVAAKGRQEREYANAASQLLKQSYGEVRGEVDAYFARVRAANAFDVNMIPAHARVAAGYAFWSIAIGREPSPKVFEALNAEWPKLGAEVADVARLATNPRVRRAFGRLYTSSDQEARADLLEFANRGRNSDPPRPRPPTSRSKGFVIGD